VPIAPFSTSRDAAVRALVDVRHLLWFRATTVRRRRTAGWAAGSFVLVTAAIGTVPAYVEGAGVIDATGRAAQFLIILPTVLAGMLVLAVVSSVASGGGRELLSNEHGVAYPVSPTTDHLGALLLAPLNIAWLLQAWTLLGVTAYAIGPENLWGAQVIALLWVLTASALAQVVAWTVEAIRRGPRGLLIVRSTGLVVGAIAVWLQLAGLLSAALDQVPTVYVMRGMIAAREGQVLRYVVTVAVLLVVIVAAIALGALPAHLAARHSPRDATRVESGARAARRAPRSDLAALVRLDRGSVWRAVPMRRGMMVLAVGPGLVALAGDLEWNTMTILPGLVASGAALLFGVNAWCLDGRGMLWRESLPARPTTVFAARMMVLGEWLLVSSGITLVLASLRAGLPAAHELTALLCTWLVVTVQVVGASMRWSAKSPFSVDMRSARATPAPPVMMVGYSARLAVSTTLTGLVFGSLARLPYWNLSIAFAIPFLVWSLARLGFVYRTWRDPVDRARIVMTVSA
jgi:hypothetical protein